MTWHRLRKRVTGVGALLVMSALLIVSAGGIAQAGDPNAADDWTSESRESDGDVVRLNDLKSLGQLLDEFHEKTGRYPLEGRSNLQRIYVYIATPEQERIMLREWAIERMSASGHFIMPLSELCAELESVLGRTVVMPFDPRRDPVHGSYLYVLDDGIYCLWMRTQNPFPFASRLRSGGSVVAVSNRPDPRGGVWDYQELMANPEFVAAASNLLHEPERFKRIREAQEQAFRRCQSQMAARAVLALDGFDGRLGLSWEILNPVADHWSLSRNPGMLTITTQPGGFVRARTDYKDIFLIDCPTPIAQDFEVTTCLVSFKPRNLWHQAGLVLWNDQDNYLKLVYEWGEGPPALTLEHQCMFTAAVEVDGRAFHAWYPAGQQMERVWLRVRKRMSQFDLFTSADGETFTPLRPMHYAGSPSGNRIPWGNGVVKRIGLFAGNGSSLNAAEVDASFDFLEVKATPVD